ncbi:MAG: hypothetical protein L6Q99_07435 [Planctomycetes bacterium]|nr:hypothetical protein [Planctomycetota bacterium]
MRSLNALFVASSLSMFAGLAPAQSIDTSAAPGGWSGTGSLFSLPTDAPIVFSNGPYITGTGNGFGGANTSEIEAGWNTFGFGCQGGTTNNRIADDFVVPAGQNWSLTKLHWLAYQTGAGTSGTITGIQVNVWNTMPVTGGSPLWSSAANVMITRTFTNVYRVTNTTLTNNTRAIFDVEADLTGSPVLAPGTYWVDVQLVGTLTSGPWAPPTVPHLATDNGRQFLGTTLAWAPTQDTTTLLPQDFPFALEGDDGTGGGCTGSVAVYCTSKVNSLGCSPSVSSTGAPQVANCASQPFNMTVSSLIGNKNGLWFYGTAGLNGIGFQGGHLCIKPAIKRLNVQNSGGQGTACNGSMTTDFNARICSGLDTALVAGATVGAQAWSRDPADPFTTSLSNALSFTICP